MRKWIPLLIVAAAFISSAVAYSSLPDRMPTLSEMGGVGPGGSFPTPAGQTQRLFGVWLTPFMILFTWGLMRWLPSIDPRGANYEKFGGAFEAIMIAVMIFMLGVHVVTLRAALGYPVAIQRVMPIGVGALLVVIGNLLPRARSNWFVGIRTPWTLSSDRVWEKTHRFGGRLFVIGGVLIVLSALLSSTWAHRVLITVVAACSLGSVVYSYVEWRKEKNASAAPAN